MAEQPVTICPRTAVHGPVNPDCPVDCMWPALSLASLHPLARAYHAPFDPPRTVGDVIELHRAGLLHEIRGLGQRRISEIEAALVFVGLDITGDSQHSLDASERWIGEGP